MTLGVTGVFWLPRMATVNSTTLNSGAHAIPISAASAAWTAIAGAYADATFTVARVMAELAVGMQGLNGLIADTKLLGFAAWAEQCAEHAAVMSVKTGANATAYSVASLAMPSLPEIATVKAAKTAAYTTGGVLNGTAEAAEVADRAMDIRAAIVMEAYEAETTTTVLTPSAFPAAPSIAPGVSGTQSGDDTDALRALMEGDPVRAASLAVGSLLQNPGVQTVAAQAGQLAGTAASVGGNIGSAAVSAVTSGANPTRGAAMGPMGAIAPMGGFGGIGGLCAGGEAGATRAAGVGAAAAPVHGLALPEGWAGAPTAGTASGPGVAAVSGATVEGGQQSFAAGRVDPTARTAGIGHMAGSRTAAADETEHETPEYLRDVEHFEDGRMVVPAVLGADR